MKKLETKQNMTKYSLSELPEEVLGLIKEAESMLKVAYAPYSNFLVGAAALLEDGTIHRGCNQENASYPLCICGERVALYNAHANSPGIKINTLAILAKNPKKPLEIPVSPCGACRQVIVEFENKQNAPIELYLKGENDVVYHIESAGILLPFSFSGDVLGE